MLKDHIVKTATEYYVRYGIKSVSMNQIAQGLRISKKTIYTEFENKTQLISACITFEMEHILKKIIETEKKSATSLEALYTSFLLLIRHLAVLCPAFHLDIQRIPEVSEKFDLYKTRINAQFQYLYNNGVKEGDLLPETDFAVVMSIYSERLEKLTAEKQFILLKTFLQGICTEQGRNDLKKIINKH